MAFFIIIGTNNDVKGVVDEVKGAHLQHNIITSGCVLKEGDDLYYKWDVFNEKGIKTKDSSESIFLHDALTNQISQFKTLIPEDAIPNVFIVSKCFDEEESKTLQMVCDELCKIGGARLSNLLIDIVLVGYDLAKPENVTMRPNWKILESIRGLCERICFPTHILYVNNMDYMGAATNICPHLLGRFLCHWSKIVCSGGYDPKATLHSHVYSIGISEHQYDFRDLHTFFELSAEERLLDRTLNNSHSPYTQELLDTDYFKKIDLDIPWLDGLRHIHSLWEKYCTAKWDPSKPISENDYSVSRQELKLASYLNSFLKLYVSEEQCEIEILNAKIAQKEVEKSESAEKLIELNELPDEDETKETQIGSLNKRIAQLDSEIAAHKSQIRHHEMNINRNTFNDADFFYEKYGAKAILTEDDETAYAINKNNVYQLIDYVKSEAGINIMRESIGRATNQYVLPGSYPASDVLNVGRVKPIPTTEETTPPAVSTIIETSEDSLNSANQNERSGCLFWFKSLFEGNKSVEQEDECYTEPTPMDSTEFGNPTPISNETSKLLNDALEKSVVAIKKADEVRKWWKRLCNLIDKYQKRLAECKLMMDGEKTIDGECVPRKEGYRPKDHRKSTSLIDMNRVRSFRDSDTNYKQIVSNFLERWFDKTIESDKRMTMDELIKHLVLKPLAGKYHTLQWDGNNPFVIEEISDNEMHDYIEHDYCQSKPFVEYVRDQDFNIVSNLSVRFFSNNRNIPKDYTEFHNRYSISNVSMSPVFLEDFVNSLCVIQIIDIPDHIDALKDFKPKRESALSKLHTDIIPEVTSFIGDACTVEEKARAIYNWLCDNIAYDTTKQIHDAETCYQTKRGVCQAYCELFCYMAEAVGLTAEIITGITKDAEGNISSEKHSWIFVYTHAYDGILIDPTWGAGAIDGKRFVKNEDNSIWFNVSPYWLIFSHFPDNPYWSQLGSTFMVTEEQFRQLPFIEMTTEDEVKEFLFECLSDLQ